MPENLKTLRMKSVVKSVTLQLRAQSARHNYPLTRNNLRKLFNEISLSLGPYYDEADDQELIDTAESIGFDLGAMNTRIASWQVQNDILTIREVQGLFNIVEEGVIAGQHLGYLHATPIPASVLGTPKELKIRNSHLNFSRGEVDVLTQEQLDQMSENATVTKSRIQQYLSLTDDERDELVGQMPVVDWIGQPHTGIALYPLWFARMTIQAWRQLDEDFDKHYDFRLSMIEGDKEIDFGYIAHGVEDEAWKHFTETERVIIAADQHVNYNVSRMGIDDLVARIKSRVRMICVAEAQIEHLRSHRSEDKEFAPRHPFYIFDSVARCGVETIRGELQALVRELRSRDGGFDIELDALAETDHAVKDLIAHIKLEGIKAP